MALTDPAKRLGAIPPYKFAELQKQVADKRAAGIDVINLGIGDPDYPTFPYVVEAMQAAVADAGSLERARLIFINYPNNPTGAVVPDGFFEQVVELAREHQILVVHDNAYSETTYDGYVAPSFLATPSAKEVGVEVFSLSKGFNMTGWRCAAILGNAEAVQTYWRLKTNVDSGLFEAVQIAGAAALRGPSGSLERMNETYTRRRDLVVGALREIGVEVSAPKGTIYVWAPVPEGHTSTSFAELVLEDAAVVVSPGSMYGPSGEGFFRISLTTPDDRISEAVQRLRAHLG